MSLTSYMTYCIQTFQISKYMKMTWRRQSFHWFSGFVLMTKILKDTLTLVMRMIGNILLEEAGLTLQYLAGMVITVMERQLDLLKVKDTLTTYVCILI